MKKLLLTTTAIAMSAMFSDPSHATVYDITGYSVPNNINDVLYSPLLPNGHSEATESGMIVLSVAGGNPLDVFCTDIKHDLQQTGFFATAPFGTGQDDPHYTTTQADEIGWLIDSYDKDQGQGSMSADQFSSATQIAIWSLEYAFTSGGVNSTALDAWNYTNGTQAGEFAYDSTDPALNGSGGFVHGLIGNAILAYNESDATTNPTELLPSDSLGNINLPANQAQAFIPVGSLNNDEPLPEPFSVTLFGTALLGLGLVRWKKRS